MLMLFGCGPEASRRGFSKHGIGHAQPRADFLDDAPNYAQACIFIAICSRSLIFELFHRESILRDCFHCA
jgi:hypothetical protein